MSAHFRITPSLLNKWQDLVDADLHWEEFYGNSDEPSISSEDYYAKCEKELLDAINRVPFISEAASRGTALNEIVDCIIENRPPREDMKVKRVYSDGVGLNQEVVAIEAELDGFTFLFDKALIDQLVEYFAFATCQHRCEASMPTNFGEVILYGDADYIIRDMVHDLKSTSKYSAYGKFNSGWQKDVYPWALTESGEVKNISGFEYTIVPLSGGTGRTPLITGEIKTEYYPYNHEAATLRLCAVLHDFIPWILEHKDKITHTRIFDDYKSW